MSNFQTHPGKENLAAFPTISPFLILVALIETPWKHRRKVFEVYSLISCLYEPD